MRVLGIDPGTIKIGIGVLDHLDQDINLVWCGVLKASPSSLVEQRLADLFASLQKTVAQFSPDHVAVEEPFVHRNVKAAMLVGEAKAAAVLAAMCSGIAVYSYSPRTVKQSVTGYGGSDKEQVQEMVRIQLGLAVPPEPLDASDAIAVALCHLQQTHLSQVLSRSLEGWQ